MIVTLPSTPSRRPVRMVDIAERAGVSRMAVSAVLMGTGNGRIGVSAKTAERIRAIADELGYRPNSAARQLAGKRSGVIAVVGHDWKNFLAQRVLAWLHESAQKHGFRILATQTPDSLDPIEELLRDARAGWVDGIVYLAHENETQWPHVARLLKRSAAVATVVGDLRVPGVTSVVSDVTPGARASMMHLNERGRRRPVLITEEAETKAIQSRIATYKQVAAECQMEFNRQSICVETKGWLVGAPEFYPRFEALAGAILQRMKADSVLCDTDFTAVGLLRAFRQLGVRVPEEISVIGWGDLQFSAVFDPRLTTVSHQLPELLTRVVKRLHRQIEVPAEAGAVDLVETSLMIRETT